MSSGSRVVERSNPGFRCRHSLICGCDVCVLIETLAAFCILTSFSIVAVLPSIQSDLSLLITLHLEEESMDTRRVNPSDTDGFSSNAIDEATLLSEDVDGVPTGNLFTSKHPGGSLRSVFVVTNRSKDVDGCLNSRPHKNGSIRYILIWVLVPNLRLLPRGGKLEESPPDDDPNPCRHVHIISWKVYDSEQLFYQAIRDVMTRTGSNQIRMLIPGFRSTANKYARITGKMARDMDFVGPILLYSWGAGKNFEYFDAQESWLKPSILPLVQILWDVKVLHFYLVFDLWFYSVNGCLIAVSFSMLI